MNFFKTPKKHEPFEMVKMSKSIEQIIEKNVTSLFKKHMKTLINEENDYIVFAVWGAKIDGTLSDEQKEINTSIRPVIKELLSILESDTLNESQKYAVEYLIRGLFISKIIYMIEFIKNKIYEAENGNSGKKPKSKSPVDELLENLNKNNTSNFPPKDGNDGFKRW